MSVRSTAAARRAALMVFAALMVCGSVIAAELLARPVWNWQYAIVTSSILKSFQYFDRRQQVVRNRPGTWTYAQLHQELLTGGRQLGVDDLEHMQAIYGLRPDDVVLRIGRRGFVGPEPRDPKPAGRLRVLTIGDSVTFGPYYDEMSYPRVLERALNDAGVPSDVINAGVQGYSLEKVLKRVDEFVELAPDLVTVMIGWNRTLIRADPDKNEDWYRRFALYRFFYHVKTRSTDATQYPGDPKNFYDPGGPLIDRLRRTTFDRDLDDWRALTDRIRARLPRCRVVVLNLAGLFTDGVEPDAQALRLAYAVTFTHNLAAWPALTSAYNERLERLAAERHLATIDLARWSRQAFQPRTPYFIDSVHPNSRGYDLMGRFIASEIVRQRLSGVDEESGSR